VARVSSCDRQIAGHEEEIEEVDTSSPALARFVPVDRFEQLLLQERGEIGVGVLLETLQLRTECVARGHDRLPGQTGTVLATISFGAPYGPLSREVDPLRFQPVEFAMPHF